MKAARFLLLVLLAVLLPLRGALADVTHCAAGTATADAAQAHSQAHSPHTMTGRHHAHAAAPSHGGEPHAGQAHTSDLHDAGTAHHAPSDGAAADCGLCTASCSTTPFVSAAPSVAAPLSIAAAVYPALIAPPPSHGSEGQERPPRSL